MTTQEIIQVIKNLDIKSADEEEILEQISFLTEKLRESKDGFLACETLIELLERNPEFDFGSPGEPVHTLEFFSDYYEDFLLMSLERQPTTYTVWMLNRIINAENNTSRKEFYLSILLQCFTHPKASAIVKEESLNFYKYQKHQ